MRRRPQGLLSDPRLKAVLRWAEARSSQGEAPRWEPISGGVTNTSYRVIAGEDRWIVRLARAEPGHDRLDLGAEQRLLEAAAAAGLAPGVIMADPGRGILITRYLAGAGPFTGEMARRADNVRRVAKRLHELHRLDVMLEPFRPAAVARRYLASADELRGARPEWRRELKALAIDYERLYPATAVCHNDLVAANILDDGEIRFIDFEYAVAGDPILDLAGLAGMNDFGTDQIACLLDAYYEDGPPYGIQAFADVIRMIRLLSYFWALSRARSGVDTDQFARFADEMAAVLR